MRYALGIEYDGNGFYGWQTQKQTPTVQQTLEEALGKVANHPVSVVCAGRTDTGVHAWCQVAHFDTDATRPIRSWVLGTNSNLPDSVCVRWIQPVTETFHARFSAFARSYRYIILNRWIRPAIDAGKVSWEKKPLDAEAMNRASKALLGEHDFSSFRSSGCKANHPVRQMLDVSVQREQDRVILDVTANGFLYHMVRNIAGSLLDVGRGIQEESWIAELLEQRDRRRAGMTASPDGLYFLGVRYPAEFELPGSPPSFRSSED